MATNGDCIFSITSEGEDSVTAGVASALKYGDLPVASVEKFINARGKHVKDESQQRIEKLLQDKKKGQSVDYQAITPMNAGGIGTVVGRTLDVGGYLYIKYCPNNGSPCMVQSKMKTDFRYTLWIGSTRETVLSGDIDVLPGWPPPFFDEVKCTTVHDGLFNIDDVVKTWGNCSINSDPFRAKRYIQIQSLTWFGGTKARYITLNTT